MTAPQGVKHVSCPFYGVSIVEFAGEPLLMTMSGNRCALITSAHSPCWMEVDEDRQPDWEDCPRNPTYIVRAANSAAKDIYADRITQHMLWLHLRGSGKPNPS